ncbi:hypothetical protein [Acrocarpospora catenulata]|uniref:hypothetical protein n=1 Tax=Acrocarpospora catenulata TaxID=2836182 RepID=UPI001BD9EB86|nr:hypothetical protein [Acrocarpospora catenulata]
MIRRPGPLSEHPFELLFGALAAVSGLVATLGIVASASINAALPLLAVRAWGVLQLAAGVLMVVGVLLPYRRRASLVVAWRLERAGLWPLAATALVYAVVAVSHSGVRALQAAVVYVALALACIARARAVTRLEQALLSVEPPDVDR